jgi:hypothetical protein
MLTPNNTLNSKTRDLSGFLPGVFSRSEVGAMVDRVWATLKQHV